MKYIQNDFFFITCYLCYLNWLFIIPIYLLSVIDILCGKIIIEQMQLQVTLENTRH